MSKMHKTESVIEVPKGLDVCEELVGIHALNPFINHSSSSRAVMFSNMLSQTITPNNGDENIIQSGLDSQFGDNTFSKKFDNDSIILGVVKRYSGVDINTASETVELTVFFEDLVTGEMDYLDVPDHFTLHQYFGFKYKWNDKNLSNIYPGTFIPAGTVLADSPSVRENKGYCYGLNTNVAYLSLPEISEDGVVVSESYAKRFNFSIFETRTIEFGEDSFALNVYGDENNYKPFPDIGEKVNHDGLLMAVRKYDDDNTLALTSNKDVKSYDPMFDNCTYVKSGDAVVVDIKAYQNLKFKKNVYTNTDNGVMKYVNGLTKYYSDIVDLYERIEKDNYIKTKTYKLPISDKLQRLVVDSYMKANRVNKNIKYVHKKAKLDIFRVDITVQLNMELKVGYKLSTISASKGVVVEIRPDNEMPYDPITGERAEIIVDPTSVPGRMNISNLYEQHFCMLSRKVKHMITDKVNSSPNTLETLTDKEITDMWSIPLGLLEIIGTKQYDTYLNATVPDKRSVIEEIYTKEFFIYYTLSSKRKAYQVVMDTKGTIYEPVKTHLKWMKDGKELTTKNVSYIGPQYIIALSKIADDYLSCPTAKINHYGFPIAMGGKQKHSLPWKLSPTKILSETESRLYTSYTSRRGLAEIKDRANSIPTHMAVYRGILDAKVPTNIDKLVDRTKVPFGNDSAITFLENILSPSGVKLEYVKDNHTEYFPKQNVVKG